MLWSVNKGRTGLSHAVLLFRHHDRYWVNFTRALAAHTMSPVLLKVLQLVKTTEIVLELCTPDPRSSSVVTKCGICTSLWRQMFVLLIMIAGLQTRRSVQPNTENKNLRN